MLSSFLGNFLYVFTSLITVVNPLGGAMFFLALTGKATRQDRAMLANRIGIYFFMMAIVTLYAGSFVLSFFGISIGVLRVAGGLVLFSTGWLALNAPTTSDDPAEAQQVKSTQSKEDFMKLAFYPFTLPLTLGPGSIAVATAIGTAMPFTVLNVVGASLAALANALIVWLCFRYADRISDRLGPSGTDAVGRIFSFILVCLGVQIFWAGFSELWLALMTTVPN